MHSFTHAITETDRVFRFIHYSAEEDAPRTTSHTLRLSVLPEFAELSKSERAKKLKALLTERMDLYHTERREAQQSFLGLRKLLEQTAGELPGNVSRSKRPFVYTKCVETWRRMRALFRARLAQYRDASFQYRQGILTAIFPPNSFKPPTHRLPRIEPFKPLPWLLSHATA